MKRVLRAVLILAVIAVAVLLTWVNITPIELRYLVGAVEIPLPVALWVSLFVGAVLGIVACMGRLLRLQRENRLLRKQKRLAETELNNLRNLPIKDGH
jgi:lipopolysaccharide assembly protein A